MAHDSHENSPPADPPLAGCGRVIGRSRYVVLIAVVAVLLVSLTLFLLGALNAFAVTGKAWNEALAHGEFAPTDRLIEILSVIDVMLRGVVFYIIGVGLYSLFITPLNLTAALSVDSLIDLETKVVSIVIVILAVSFLEHFVRWEKPGETLNFAAALAIVVAALAVFQWNNQPAKEFEKTHRPEVQARAERDVPRQTRGARNPPRGNSRAGGFGGPPEAETSKGLTNSSSFCDGQGASQNGAASVWSHGIDLRGHDEIIAVETSNLVRPESDCHPTPFG